MTDATHQLGEVLRAAREAKGVDLVRVERETKIRERYLSALERGEYRELPGAVYTKGFLRNYGAYLGLDPEYLIDLYRLETASGRPERPAAMTPPKPLAVKRSRAFVITPGAIFASLITVGVVLFVAYIGFELVNFARQPELRILEPPGNVSGHTELTITVRGQTEPNATVTFSDLRENPTVTADASGAFEVTVRLVPGSNVMRVVAHDPKTNRDTEAEERTIVVVADVPTSPSAAPVALDITAPLADATVTGPLAIAGTTVPGGTVTATATLSTAPTPAFSIVDAAGSPVAVEAQPPAAPEALVMTADAAGAVGGSLALPAGTWQLTFTPSDGEPVTRTVTVGTAADAITARLDITGGDSWMEIQTDGAPVDGLSGGLATDGRTIDLSATEEVRVRAGNAGAVVVTIDGITLGPMGAAGEVVEWRITRAG